MQVDYWDKYQIEFWINEHNQTDRRMYVKTCYFLIYLRLSVTKTTVMKFPDAFIADMAMARDRKLWHPRFDMFFEQVKEEDVFMWDFFEAYEKAMLLYKRGRLRMNPEVGYYLPKSLERIKGAKPKMKKILLDAVTVK